MDFAACAITFVSFAKAIYDTVQRYRYSESHAIQIRLDYDGLFRTLSTVCDILVTERFQHRQLDADIQILIREASQKLEELEGVLRSAGGGDGTGVGRVQFAVKGPAYERLRNQVKNIDDHLQRLVIKFNW